MSRESDADSRSVASDWIIPDRAVVTVADESTSTQVTQTVDGLERKLWLERRWCSMMFRIKALSTYRARFGVYGHMLKHRADKLKLSS